MRVEKRKKEDKEYSAMRGEGRRKKNRSTSRQSMEITGETE